MGLDLHYEVHPSITFQQWITVPTQPKRLAYQPFDPVSHDGSSHAAMNRQTQPVLGSSIRHAIDEKQAGGFAHFGPVDGLVFTRVRQPLAAGKVEFPSGFWNWTNKGRHAGEDIRRVQSLPRLRLSLNSALRWGDAADPRPIRN